MTRKKIAAGNLKMNLLSAEVQSLISACASAAPALNPDTHRVVFAPAFTALAAASAAMQGRRDFFLSAQNAHASDSGAFTGEVSVPMLADAHCSYVIIGHSERRQYFGESHSLLADKTAAVLRHGLIPIFCIGETLEERTAGKVNEIIGAQLKDSLFGLSGSDFTKIVIAYEPVWAIGTGVTATPDQAQEVHAWIRSSIAAAYSTGVAAGCTILYGGSVNPGNAATLFSMPDIDGGLVGGASMKPETFLPVIEAITKA